MAENLMNSEHKVSSDAYREGWDRTFRKDDSRNDNDPCPCIQCNHAFSAGRNTSCTDMCLALDEWKRRNDRMGDIILKTVYKGTAVGPTLMPMPEPEPVPCDECSAGGPRLRRDVCGILGME